jgi:hypothetical protein
MNETQISFIATKQDLEMKDDRTNNTRGHLRPGNKISAGVATAEIGNHDSQ